MKSRDARRHELRATKREMRAARRHELALRGAAIACLLIPALLPSCSHQAKVESPADTATAESEQKPDAAADPCATAEGAASADCDKSAASAAGEALAAVRDIEKRACACESLTCARAAWEDFQKVMLKYRDYKGNEEELRGMGQAAGHAFECLTKQGITREEMTAFTSQFDDETTEVGPADGGTAPAASDDEAVDESWWESAIQFTEQLADLVDTHKDDCDTMGKELSAFIDNHRDMIEKSKQLEKHPEAAKRFMEKNKDRLNAAMAKLAPLSQCANNPNVQEALQKLQ